MRTGLSKLTPCGIALVAIPFAFLTMPEDVPFAYAACGSGLSGNVGNMGAVQNTCYDCVSTIIARVWSYTLDNSSNFCEFKVTVDYQTYRDCVVTAEKHCDPPAGVLVCPPLVTLSSCECRVTKSATTQCNSTADTWRIVIAVGQVGTCICCNPIILDATASATDCVPQ